MAEGVWILYGFADPMAVFDVALKIANPGVKDIA